MRLVEVPAHGSSGEEGAAAPADGPAALPETGTFVPGQVNIAPERMLRILGYRKGVAVRKAVERAARETAELAAAAISPVVHYRRLRIADCDSAGLRLVGGAAFSGPVFLKYLAGCGDVVAFVLTLGASFEATTRRASDNGDLLQAVFLDAAGWIAIEEVTRLYSETLALQARTRGLELTRRLAPGYGFRFEGRKVDWPLDEQKTLFGLFAGTTLPVELLDSAAMVPKMSRTGLYGLRRRAPTGHDVRAQGAAR
jgi:hypothetical protein